MIFLIFTVLTCYVLMQSIETISFSSRIAGKLTGRLALGTTIQTSVYTMNRVFLPPLLLAYMGSFLVFLGLNLYAWLT